ncbi:hypothetical protein GCM10027293_03000 [Pontibacter aydingkolensis]
MAATSVYAQTPNMSSNRAKAEREISKVTNTAQLKKLSNESRMAYTANKQRALDLAKQKNWAIRQVNKDGQVMSLEGVDALGFPIYYVTENNTRAAASVKTDQLWAGGSTGLNLSGSNPALSGKLGVWDGGLIRGTHQELTGRTVNRDNSTAISDHATHVAGTMMAKGVNPLAKGMSFGAPNIQGWDFSNDVAEMMDAAAGLLVSNHSYGTITGWYYNTSRAGTTSNPFWELRANPNVSATEDYNFGYYNTTAQDFDKIAYNAPFYLIVKSAGNNRNQTGPALGQPYWKLNASSAWVLEPQRQAGISSNNSYDIISTYGTAKNILTVGAVEPIPNGWQRKEDVRISTFSSYGPTDDGRIKPDVVGNGVAVMSPVGTANDAYSSYNGTSMAAPNVSGSLNLLQEHYYNKYGMFMRAATLKGLAIHTADEAGNTGPDYIYGWGLLNTERAANAITNADGNYVLQERNLDQGQTYTFTVTASGKGPLVVTISWTDVEGVVLPIAASTLNNRSPRLINDLDIRVGKGLATYLPWILDPNNPANPAGFGDNIRDNVEQVYIANAVPGETYTITVSHKGTLSRGPQAYSLLVSGAGGAEYCASGAISDTDSKISAFSFGGINNTTTACATYSNFTNLIATAQVGQTLPLSLTLGTCDADYDKIAKVYIDWNGNGSFDDAGELVATTPVMSSSGIFNTNVTVPQSVAVNTQTRLRVVLVETNNANAVGSCGSYAKGETQDYLLQFTNPTKDIGVASLLFPTQNLCANPAQPVSVLIRNYASEAQSNLPVNVTVTSEGATVASFNTVYTGTLAAYSEARIILPGTFAVEAGKTYTVTSQVTLADDQYQSNNQRTDILQASAILTAPVATATTCGTSPVALKGSGEGTIYWYDAETGGNLMAVGNNVLTTTPPAGNTYYAAFNDFSGKVGPATKGAFTGGGYGQYSPSVLVTAHAPFVLESARLYIGSPGRITFSVETLAGAPISSTTLDVTNTRTAVGTEDDPADGGAVYPLNLTFPAAGNYRISVSFENGATIYRSNAGVSGYPFSIANVMSITSNTATGTPLNFYYYFFDMNIKAMGCPSSRVAVPVTQSPETVALITPASATTICTGSSVLLQANTGEGLSYTWYKNGTTIANANGATYEATTSGNYTVNVTSERGCPKLSEAVAVTVNPLPPASIAITQDVNLSMCLGEGFTQTLRAVTSTTHSSYTYQWYKNGSQLESATSATYAATSNGSYTVELSSSCGAPIASAPVVINNEAPQITAAPATTCQGSNATLTAQATSGKLFWFDAETGGKLLQVGNSYTTPNLTQSRNYYVAASNETKGKLGSTNHSSGGGASNFTGGRMYFNASVPFVLEKATLNVATAGTMTVVITDKDLSNTIISSVTINVTSGVKEYDLGLIIPAAGNNYGIQVSAFGGGATAYRNNSTNSAPYPYTLAGIASITGNNQSVPSSFYYFLYEWQVSASSCQTAARVEAPVTVSPTTVAGTLTTSAIEVCSGNNSGTVMLSGNTGNVVNWESSLDGTNWTTITSTATSIPFENLTATTSYRAVVQSGTCDPTTTQPVTITVTPATVAGTLTASTAEVCTGTNVGTLALAGHTGAIVQWEQSTDGTNWTIITQTAASLEFSNLTNSTRYRALVKNSVCSEAYTNVVTVKVNGLPIATITASGATTFCQGGSVTLSAPAGTDYTYLWSNGATTQAINVMEAGDYTVTVTGTGNCSVTSAATTVTVNELPTAAITADGPTTFCQGGSVTLAATEGTSYLWSNGATTRSITVTGSGSYTVTVTNAKGCSATSQATVVQANEIPTKPAIVHNGHLLASSAVSGNQWYLNGVAISGATSQTLTVTKSGNYSVIVISASQCVSVMSDEVTVNITALAKESEAVNGVQVYPNPNTGRFTIGFTVNKTEKVKLVLVNSIGKVLYENTQSRVAGTHEEQVSLHNLPTGVYILQIHTNGKVLNRKIVVKH